MNIEWKNLANGLRNHLLPPKDKRELIQEVHDTRMAICRMCPKNSVNAKLSGYESIRRDEHCTICLCPLVTKTKSLSTQCPDVPPRWEMILNDEERLKVEAQILKDEKNLTNSDKDI